MAACFTRLIPLTFGSKPEQHSSKQPTSSSPERPQAPPESVNAQLQNSNT